MSERPRVLFVLPTLAHREQVVLLSTIQGDGWQVVACASQALRLAMRVRVTVVVVGEGAGDRSGEAFLDELSSVQPDVGAVWIGDGGEQATLARLGVACSVPGLDDERALRDAIERAHRIHMSRQGSRGGVEGQHVLLVEDHLPDAVLTGRMLRRIGWTHTHVKDLDGARKALASEEFCLVLTDLSLPDAHGLDAVGALSGLAPGVPLVVLSGVEDLALEQQTVRQGAQDHLIKGQFDARRLRRVLLHAVERKRSERHLADLAHTDSLTGVANRRSFLDTLRRAVRSGPEQVAVVLVDLDGFKAVNDSRGHATGDEVLQHVADRLRACLRPTDEVGRLGGDEFGIVLTDLATADDVEAVAARVTERIAFPFEVDGVPLGLSASVGVAVSDGPQVTAEELLHRADVAMYKVKVAGKNGVSVWGRDVQDEVFGFSPSSILAALRRRELTFHYQVQQGRISGRPVCLEALLRWEHPTFGWVMPSVFLPVIEGSDVMVQLSRASLDWALEDLAFLRANGLPDVRVAFNLSALQLEDPELVERVQHGLERYALPGDALELEVTERTLIRDLPAVAKRLATLRSMGVRVALDDLGAGFSALSVLASIPVDLIKIDRSLVELAETRRGRLLLESLVELGHRLELEVVAEGVETQGQLEVVEALKVDRIQGYLLGRAQPPTSFVDSQDLRIARGVLAG